MEKEKCINSIENSIDIFNVAHSSIYDGPGIRVVVFFQGCVANCKWCHSPHSNSKQSPLLFNENHCFYCGKCGFACPNGVHSISNKKHLINRRDCIQCGRCIYACPLSSKYRPSSVLYLPTITYSVSQLFKKLKPHLSLVQNSGGITLSGGEALIQKPQVKELLSLCKEMNISTAIETSGLLPINSYTNLEGLVDFWLFGMRFTTDGTSVDHAKKIYDSLKTIKSYNKPILPRIPVVPGHTDTNWYLEKCMKLLKSNDISSVFLNPWNTCTDHYYRLSGIDFMMSLPSKISYLDSESKMKSFFEKKDISILNIEDI